MKRTALLTATVAFCVAALAGTAGAATVIVSLADADATIHLNASDELVVNLPENTASTGYSWTLVAIPNSLMMVGVATYTSSNSQSIGASGTRTFRFGAKNLCPQTERLMFELQRPWESAAIKRYRIMISNH